MTCEEFLKLCDALKSQGMTNKDILGTIHLMYKKGKIDLEDMKKLAGALGYELTDEFIKKETKKEKYLYNK